MTTEKLSGDNVTTPPNSSPSRLLSQEIGEKAIDQEIEECQSLLGKSSYFPTGHVLDRLVTVIKRLQRENERLNTNIINFGHIHDAVKRENAELKRWVQVKDEAIKSVMGHILALNTDRYNTSERIGLILERLDAALALGTFQATENALMPSDNLLDVHAICDQRDKAIADCNRLRSERDTYKTLAEEAVKMTKGEK